MSREQFNRLTQERDQLKAALEQEQYSSENLREILAAYQEHIQSARPVDDDDEGSGKQASKTVNKEVERLNEQLSVASSRNSVLSSEIEHMSVESQSLRDIMDAMREDLVKAQEREESLESEHDERLGLLAEQLESLKKNGKRARSEKRKAERSMDESSLEIGHLKEQLASQESQLIAVTSEQSDQQAEALIKTKEQMNKVKTRLCASEAKEREIELLLQRFEMQSMEREDLATQHAELYQLEAELNSIRQADVDERTQQQAREADSRARDAEQRLAEETAGKIRAEKDRDAALQQLSIIQERFGVADRSGQTFGYGNGGYGTMSSKSGDTEQRGEQRGEQRDRSNSEESTASTLEQRFKMIQNGGGDIRQSLLAYPGPLSPSQEGSLHDGLGRNDDKVGSEGCCCIVQ